MTRQLAAAAYAGAAIAYFGISYIVGSGLVRTGQIRTNRLASRRAIEETLKRSREIITELLGERGTEIELGSGDLRRTTPVTIAESDGAGP